MSTTDSTDMSRVETITENQVATTSTTDTDTDDNNEDEEEVEKDSSYSDTKQSSSDNTITLCPLYNDGCRYCYELNDCHNQRNRIIPSIIPTACLFGCSVTAPQDVKDQYAVQLDRILRQLTTINYTSNIHNNNNNNNNNNHHPLPQTERDNNGHQSHSHAQLELPVGTEVLCCWHINGQRHWCTIQKSRPCVRRHWDEASGVILYSIRFTDGWIRHDVPRSELFSTLNYESDLYKETVQLLHGEKASNVIRLKHCEHHNAIAESCSHKAKRKKPSLGVDVVTAKAASSHNQNCLPQQRTSSRLSPLLSLQELFRRRCQICCLCRLPDCSVCESCIQNSTTTSIYRQVCIQNMCTKIPIEQKQQPSSHGWYFYMESLHCNHSQSIHQLHPIYRRLRLIAPQTAADNYTSKTKSFSILTAMHECTSDKERVELGTFFETILGQLLHERCSHTLLSKQYLHEYSNTSGTNTDLSGTIVNCKKHLIHRTLLFTVKFDKHFCTRCTSQSASCIHCGSFIIEHVVSEQMAWGGYQMYCKRQKKKRIAKDILPAPFAVNWMIPSNRYLVDPLRSQLPYLELEFRGCVLQFKAKPSRIRGAGTGLFVKSLNGKHLTLNAGEMLDLGVYVPLQSSNVKSKHISLIKNLIYDWTIEPWSFATQTRSNAAFAYDPTDDFTGILQVKAKRNLISYVNEVSSNDEVANVSAQYDPEGNVHYLLGHIEEHEGTFNISSDGKLVELLIDYGPAYERCRMRNGYPRIPLNSLQNMSVIKSEEDATAVADIANFSFNQLKDCLEFLEVLYESGCSNFDERNHQLALITAFALEDRHKGIMIEFDQFDFAGDEFCDEGVSTMILTNTIQRFNVVISAILRKFHDATFRTAVSSMKLLEEAVSKRIKCDILHSSIQRSALKKHLLNLYG